LLNHTVLNVRHTVAFCINITVYNYIHHERYPLQLHRTLMSQSEAASRINGKAWSCKTFTPAIIYPKQRASLITAAS